MPDPTPLRLDIDRCITTSTNYNQFLPCPGLNGSRYGIVHSERLGYQLWQRPLKMASTVYETEISVDEG